MIIHIWNSSLNFLALQHAFYELSILIWAFLLDVLHLSGITTEQFTCTTMLLTLDIWWAALLDKNAMLSETLRCTHTTSLSTGNQELLLARIQESKQRGDGRARWCILMLARVWERCTIISDLQIKNPFKSVCSCALSFLPFTRGVSSSVHE